MQSLSTHPSSLYFGGTFDPPHLGHQEMILMAQARGFNSVLIVPAGDPIHKQHKTITPFEHRYKMCQMAFGAMDGVTVSDIENTLAKPTPTVTTLRAAISDFDSRTERIPFLLGADALESLPSWVEAEMLAQKLLFIVAGRKGHPIKDSALIHGQKYPLKIILLETPPDEASSKIQPLFQQQETPIKLSEKVGANVQAYIEEHQLYTQSVKT